MGWHAKRLAVGILAALLCSAGALHAEDTPGTEETPDALAAEKQKGRAALFKTASEAVFPQDPRAGDLTDAVAFLAGASTALREARPDLIARAQALLGLEADQKAELPLGLIREGSRLWRSVAQDRWPDEVVVTDAPAPAPDKPAGDAGAKDGEPTKAETDAPSKDGPAKDDEKAPAKQPAEPESPKETPEPAPSIDPPVPLLVVLSVARAPTRAADDTNVITSAPPNDGDKASLPAPLRTLLQNPGIRLTLERTQPDWKAPLALPGIPNLIRAMNDEYDEAVAREFQDALASPEELSLSISARWYRWRALQSRLRLEDLKADVPPETLTTIATLTAKIERTKNYEGSLRAYETKRERLTNGVDRLVIRRAEIQRHIATVSAKITELKKGLSAPKDQKPEPTLPPDKQRALDELTLDEFVNEQGLRLLYITAARTQRRLEVLDNAIALAKDELRAARANLKAYQSARERYIQQNELQTLQDSADVIEKALKLANTTTQEATSEGNTQGAETSALWASALTDIQKLNALAQDVVKARADVVERLSPSRWVRQDTGEETTQEIKNRFGAPTPGDVSEAYIKEVRPHLGDVEGFTARMVAANYEAADIRAEAMRQALGATRDIRARTPEHEGLMASVRDKQRQLETRDPAQAEYLGQLILELDESIQRARDGIVAQAEEAKRQIASLDAFRNKLLGLGSRSFTIRVNRDLSTSNLEAAAIDTRDATDRATQWISMESKPNAGDFIRENWARLLACLAILFIAIVFVRRGRRWIDGVLDRQAAKFPLMRRPNLSVAGDADAARAQRAQEDAALQQAADVALAKSGKTASAETTSVETGNENEEEQGEDRT